MLQRKLMSSKFFRDVDTVAERKKVAAAEQARQTTITSDETVLWRGRPAQGIQFRLVDLWLVPFSLIWFLGAMTMIISGGFSARGNGTIAQISHVPHVIIFPIVGFYFAFGRFITDAWYRAKLTYIVTNQKVLIESRFPTKSTTSIDRRTNTGLRLELQPNGLGTIYLTEVDIWYHTHQRIHAALFHRPMLFRIENASAVFNILQEQPAKNR